MEHLRDIEAHVRSPSGSENQSRSKSMTPHCFGSESDSIERLTSTYDSELIKWAD